MSLGLFVPVDELDPRTWPIWTPTDRRIHATNKLELSVLLDEDVYFELARFTWNCFTTKASKIYFRRSVWVPGAGKRTLRLPNAGQNRTILLHQDVMRVRGVEAPQDGQRWVVDHLDGEELDCRFRNLRWATYKQNRENRK